MIYQYECSNGHTLEVTQSIHDEPLTQCECGGHLERIITGGLGFFMDTPRTLGALAEKNRSKLGHYERENLDRPSVEKLKKKKEQAPWWRPNTTGPMKELNNMTTEQQQKYINGG